MFERYMSKKRVTLSPWELSEHLNLFCLIFPVRDVGILAWDNYTWAGENVKCALALSTDDRVLKELTNVSPVFTFGIY